MQEEDILDVFSEFGPIKNLHLNLDRRTGYAKGYAFIEYEQRKDAEEAIESMNGKELSGKAIKIDWAFREAPHESSKSRSKRSSKRKH